MVDEIKHDLVSKPQDVLDRVLQLPDDQIIPWEDVVLPSRGHYYNGRIPEGKVKVRPMTLAAEKVLATQRLAQSGQSIDWLFKQCIQFPDQKFDPSELLVGDTVFLLYYLRGITYGNNYGFLVKCTSDSCGQTSTHEYDLNELSNTIKIPDITLGQEPFKVVLPNLSKTSESEFWVKIRLMRRGDMQSMLQQRQVARKINPQISNTYDSLIDNSLEDNLNLLVVEAMGSTDKLKIKKIINRLHATDTATIREFLRDNSPGIDTAISVTCPTCNNEMMMELPVTENFFRLGNRKP